MTCSFVKQAALSITAGGVMFLAAVVAVSAQTISVTGNGANSKNSVNASSESNTFVGQTNNLEVATAVHIKADTGNNQANNNTGGHVTIDTGKAESEVTVAAHGGDNNAMVGNNCSCVWPELKVEVSKNGSGSNNRVRVSNQSTTAASQLGSFWSYTDVAGKTTTGKNSANKNTGWGEVKVKTGDAKSKVAVEAKGGSNSVLIP